MGESQRPKWLIWAGVALAVVLALCCVGAGLAALGMGYIGQRAREGMEEGLGEAEAYRGQPIEACWEDTFERVPACGEGVGLRCRMRGQLTLTGCLQVAIVSDAFCEQWQASNACTQECAEARAEMETQNCVRTCAQLQVPVRQFCERGSAVDRRQGP